MMRSISSQIFWRRLSSGLAWLYWSSMSKVDFFSDDCRNLGGGRGHRVAFDRPLKTHLKE